MCSTRASSTPGRVLSFTVPSFGALRVVLTLAWVGVIRELTPLYNVRVATPVPPTAQTA
jgi:hypothetical protein